MLKISGQVINLFTVDGGIDKEGKSYEPRSKVQLLGNVSMPNGDVKMDLMDLTIDDVSLWQEFMGKKIVVDIGAFAPNKGNITYFLSKGAKPVLV